MCYGYVFFGLALYSTTHIKLPYTEAQRWLILANKPLVVFAVSGLRSVFEPHRRRGLLKVGAAIAVVGCFGFAQFANSHSIEYTLYQSNDIDDAIVYARWTAPSNRSNLVTTHEGLWLAVLLGYDEIHNEWDEIYFKKTRGYNDSMPAISGTVFLTKRPHGTIPWTDSITQRMYIFNETGKYPDKSTRYMQHKIFENDNVWITENI